ncbi:MAG: anthranilate phosphoribosyltransferase [Candidatus Hadarchaeum sp.]|uniref:anthranilate phosphoribosyltransferase n=1 Tax=Candidatus Hadarchaeum sp. TaxID=2883567 RepID=UPI00316F84EE
MNSVQDAIKKLVQYRDLTWHEAEEAMKEIMFGEATEAQIGSVLTALRMKGETAEEIAAFASAMRRFAIRINPRVNGLLVDICGTGGDKIKTFNVSTVAMFVAAGAGVVIAKHGNRSQTSKSGSADVIESIGVKIDLPPQEVERCIERIGLGFMFAPSFHRAMKHVMRPRREIKIPTVFNLLGPLTNPAGAQAQVVGTFDAVLTEKMACILEKLGCKRAMVVHGLDGLDEISILGGTQISELIDGEIATYTVYPEQFGIPRVDPDSIVGGDVEKNARILLEVLKGERGPKREIVLLNAAAAIVVAGKADNLREAVAIAEDSIDSGRAYEKMLQLIKATGGDLQKLERLEAV